MMLPAMTLDYLADRREFTPVLARWLHAEWGRLRPTETVAARTARLEGACGHRQVPTAFVAVTEAGDDGDPRPLGCARLVACDLATRAELSPWLAGVFVAPAHRGRGVGAALVGRVIEEARVLGFPRLYLYTPGPGILYTRLGWMVRERTLYPPLWGEQTLTVMEFVVPVS